MVAGGHPRWKSSSGIERFNPETRLSDSFSKAMTGVLAVCAISLTILAIHRELTAKAVSADGPRTGIEAAPLARETWKTLIEGGHRRGPVASPVTIVVFTDFECPACRRLALSGLRGVVERFEGEVAVVYRHWPLPYHRFAMPAARAVECAHAQGNFDRFADLLFEKQDSLGLKSFESYASDAGVADSARFAACAHSSTPVPAIEHDRVLPSRIGAEGTPTLIVNGVLIRGVPDSARLDSIIIAANRKSSLR